MTLNSFYKLKFLMLLSAVLFSCEDPISPKLEYADPVLVVDAWLNNKVEDQKVKLTWSQPYLQNELPQGVSGAVVLLSYNEEVVAFEEDDSSPGTYLWKPASEDDVAEVFGTIGRAYKLTIQVGEETFEATSRIKRTVAIDSITFKLEEDSPFYPENSYTAQFWAKDLPGPGDTYWIKGYKNGVFLNKPSEITLAYDAGFAAGGNFDGTTFIPPLREVNPEDVDENDEALSPYLPGDSLYVEIHSISLESYNFLDEVIVQTDRPGGFAELFSSPLSNVSTNIVNTIPGGRKAIGFFNVSAVSGLGKKLVE
jgi:hypothetical protein